MIVTGVALAVTHANGEGMHEKLAHAWWRTTLMQWRQCSICTAVATQHRMFYLQMGRGGHAREVGVRVADAVVAVEEGQHMYSSSNVGLQDDIVIPIVLSVHLFRI
jgi:hypothetical protein